MIFQNELVRRNVMKQLRKRTYNPEYTIEGFAKRCKCECICGCNCFGPDVLHVGSNRRKNSNSGLRAGVKARTK